MKDLKDYITSKVLELADNTKLFHKIEGNDELVKCYDKWNMLCSFRKCKCLISGRVKWTLISGHVNMD